MKRLLVYTTVVAGAMFFRLPAYAANTVNDSWTSSITNITGKAPSLLTSGDVTSNKGFITPISNPDTQTVVLNTNTPTEYLFAVHPNNTSGISTADVAITMTLTDNNGGTRTFTVFGDYFANAGTDIDSIAWSNTDPGASLGFLTSGSLTDIETLSDNEVVNVTFAYGNDWDMAIGITFDETVAPHLVATPEPYSIALLGFGLLGTLAFRRRQRR